MIERVAENPAVQVAKTYNDDVYVTRTGYSVRLSVFPSMLVHRAMQQIKMPKVPLFHNEEKGRDEPNPNDPDYLEAVRQAEQARNNASIDASILFGVQLIDNLPSDDRWIRRLKLVGIEVNAEDDVEKEFAFLKYVVFSNAEDLELLTSQLNVTEKGVTEAVESFRGDEERPAD